MQWFLGKVKMVRYNITKRTDLPTLATFFKDFNEPFKGTGHYMVITQNNC